MHVVSPSTMFPWVLTGISNYIPIISPFIFHQFSLLASIPMFPSFFLSFLLVKLVKSLSSILFHGWILMFAMFRPVFFEPAMPGGTTSGQLGWTQRGARKDGVCEALGLSWEPRWLHSGETSWKYAGDMVMSPGFRGCARNSSVLWGYHVDLEKEDTEWHGKIDLGITNGTPSSDEQFDSGKPPVWCLFPTPNSWPGPHVSWRMVDRTPLMICTWM